MVVQVVEFVLFLFVHVGEFKGLKRFFLSEHDLELVFESNEFREIEGLEFGNAIRKVGNSVFGSEVDVGVVGRGVFGEF